MNLTSRTSTQPLPLQILGKIAPGFPAVLASQGWCEYELGNLSKARLLADKSQASNLFLFPDAPLLLGQIDYDQGNYEAALEHWEHDHRERAWAFLALNRYSEARQSLEKCPPGTPGLDEVRRALDQQDPTEPHP